MIDPNTQSGKDRGCPADGDCYAGLSSMGQLPDCCTNKQTSQKVCFNKTYLALPAIAAQWSCP
jgi:hypothetical protein